MQDFVHQQYELQLLLFMPSSALWFTTHSINRWIIPMRLADTSWFPPFLDYRTVSVFFLRRGCWKRYVLYERTCVCSIRGMGFRVPDSAFGPHPKNPKSIMYKIVERSLKCLPKLCRRVPCFSYATRSPNIPQALFPFVEVQRLGYVRSHCLSKSEQTDTQLDIIGALIITYIILGVA